MKSSRAFALILLVGAAVLLYFLQTRQDKNKVPPRAKFELGRGKPQEMAKTNSLASSSSYQKQRSSILRKGTFSSSPTNATLNRINPLLSAHPNSSGIKASPLPIAGMTKEDRERLRGLAAGVRTAKAEHASRQFLSPEQKLALARLDHDVGAPITLRVRPESGTPRFLKLPSTGTVQGSAPTDMAIAAYDFLKANRALLLLVDPVREMKATHQHADETGRTHVRFEQQYQGLAVWPAQVALHLNAAGAVELLDGAFVPTPSGVATNPVVSETSAIAFARVAVTDGARATATPANLIVFAPGGRPPRLAWRSELEVSTESKWAVVVDALTGATLAKYSLVMDDGPLTGSGIDLGGGTRTLHVWQQASTYYLVDTSKPMFDPGSSPPSKPRGAIQILDGQHGNGNTVFHVTSSQPSSGWLRDGVSAAFGLAETFDYYAQRHGRNSIDGNGGTIVGVVRYSQNYQNAFWNGQIMVFGDAEPYAGALDVLGHELTHGVTQNSANLIYQDQSGAINEAMSDIFGESVEDFARGSHDWLVGTDLTQPLRSLSNPSSLQFVPGHAYPSKMSEFYGPNDPTLNGLRDRDHGGVHINSSIINHAFYLLSEGLANSVGLLDAGRIFYRALTLHLVPQSEFLDARLASIQSAKELFGDASVQAQRTAEAFDAVEIFDGTGGQTPTPNPTVTGPDSALFVYDNGISLFLGRREDAQGDAPEGVKLSANAVSPARPSVSGDGSFATFVNSQKDMSLIETDGSTSELNLGFPGQISSVAMAPDGDHYGFVFLDASGNPEKRIMFIDTTGSGTNRIIPLVSPTADGETINTVLFADQMCFSPDNRHIVYDAFNALRLSDGTTNGVWSIYAYDLQTSQTFTLLPPTPGLDIGDPALGHTDDSLITFEAKNQQTGVSTIMAASLVTGDVNPIGTVQGIFSLPCFNGEDSVIVYSQIDNSTTTGTSLVRQPMAADHITPSGSAVSWVSDAGNGIVYRRGTWTPPSQPSVADLRLQAVVSASAATVGDVLRFTFIVANDGPGLATNAVFIGTLPDSALVVATDATLGQLTQNGSRITWKLASLAANSDAILTILIRTTVPGSVRCAGSVVADQTDPNPASNNASAVAEVADAGAGTFVPVKGTFNGLFYETNGAWRQSAGSLTLTLSAKGSFTARLQVGGSRLSWSGRFDDSGVAEKTFFGKAGTLDISLSSIGSNSLGGVLSNPGAWVAHVFADRASFDTRINPAPHAGKYTVVFPGGTNDAVTPGGDSYGTVTIDQAGRARFVGAMADGTKITQATAISSVGLCPFFVPLYGGLGATWSWLAFNPNTYDAIAGDVSWNKQSGAKSKLYFNGFSLATSALGSHYEKPASGVSILGFSEGQIYFLGGDAAQSFLNPVTIVGTRVRNGGVNKLTLTLSAASGSFSGRVSDPGNPGSFPFNGVVLQDFGFAAGFFLGPARSGEVFLEESQ